MLLSLISGSSGNSSLFTHNGTNILIDCGMSGRALTETLKKLDMCGHDIDAIFVTHEHIDHTAGVGVVSRRFNLPVYATEQTHEAMNVGRIADENIKIIAPDRPIEIGDVVVDAFSIPHDAKDPVGYRFFADNKKFALATDIGTITDDLFDSLSGSKEIILEANHDIDMLKNGPYPEHLKSRILSNFGHMSNDLSAETALSLINRGTEKIMLAHLSNENNTPEKAFSAVSDFLKENGVSKKDVMLSVAKRYEVTKF
ncbi:MAG: MBL fold metallo-hydrolase [Clostridia bacterium]|nr:MBL fold metallo-hydrolase [Clostridia bacterium]